MTTDSQQLTDLTAMTIRELVAELTRVEHRLNTHRIVSGRVADSELARLQRRMSAIQAQLHERRTGISGANESPNLADEADLLEQSIPVDGDPEEDYPPVPRVSSSC